MRAFLALHTSVASERANIVAVSSDAALLARFKRAVLRKAEASIEQATNDVERKLAEIRFLSLREMLDVALEQQTDGRPEVPA